LTNNPKQKLEQEDNNNKPFDYIHLEKYKKQQEPYSKAIIRDVMLEDIQTGEIKKRSQPWPYQKGIDEQRYETFITSAINPETNEPYGPKDDEGNAITVDKKITYTIKNIYRVKLSNSNTQVLMTQGTLEGWDALGNPVSIPLQFPEQWSKTIFKFDRVYDNDKRSFRSECLGPVNSVNQYLLPYTPETVKYIYENHGLGFENNNYQDESKVTVDNNVNFYLMDERSGITFPIKWSSQQQSYELFRDKDWDYLYQQRYLPDSFRSGTSHTSAYK
jgi:hypothetical protein